MDRHAMMGISIALMAAVLYSLGGVMQHRAIAMRTQDAFDAAALGRAIAQPLWLAGLGVMALAVLTQLAALAVAALVTVQTIMTTMVLWVLIFAALLEKARLGVREYVGSFVVAIGVVGFVSLTSPREPQPSADALRWAVAAALAVLVTAGLIVLARRLSCGPAAAVLGSAAGIMNVLGSGLASAALVVLSASGLSAMLASWLPYGAAVVLVVSIAATAMAFAAGPVTASIPPMIAANPVVGLILGTALLGQSQAMNVTGWAWTTLALGVMVTGIVILARSHVVAAQFQQPAPRGAE